MHIVMWFTHRLPNVMYNGESTLICSILLTIQMQQYQFNWKALSSLFPLKMVKLGIG